MYIKASNTKNVVDMKDYALIELLPVYLNDGYYTKEVVDKFINEIVMGEVDLKGYIDEKELTMALNGFIKEIKIQYRQTDDPINDPADNDDLWADDIPEWINEKFVWQRLVIDYGNGEKYYSDPVCISGAKGDTGEKGRSLIGITPQWCLNNDGNWNNFIPELTEYDTIWIRHELQWDYPAETNYTPEVQDFVYEKVKELFNRMVAEEENTAKVEEELKSIKENITEIEEDYATKDELENVVNSNRINMFRNGDFYDGQTGWSIYGSGNNIPRLQENKTYPHGKAIVIQGEPTHIQHLSQIIHPIANIIGQEYTISCMINCDNADDGFDMPLYGLKVEVYYGKEVVDEIFAEVENFDNEWCKLSTTFTVEQDYDYFECSFYVRDTSKTIRVVGFMFEEGNLANPFQINVREIQNKIPTRLGQLENDKDYITLNELDLSGYALIEDIPIKLSELEQDMDYLTEHQDISHLVLQSEVDDLYNELREMFIVDEPQKAVFNNRPYIFACGHPLIVEGKDGEVVITYAVNDTNTEMGEIRVPVEEAKSLVIVGGFGDANIDRTRILPATHIHVRNVDIQAVYGGNLFEGIVGESTIIIENSSVKEVIGGGDAGRFIEGRWAVRNNVAKANIKLTNVKSSLVFIGGSGGPSNVAEANIELNGNCEIAWLTAGGSNGFTSKSKVVINDGKYECVQMVNRGLVDEAKLVMNGGHIIRAYFAGEAEDATVTGVVNHVVFELNNGKIEKLARGNSNSIEFNGEIKGHIMDCVVLDGDVSMLEKTEPNNAIEDLQAQIDELKAIIEELKNNN